MLLYDFKKIELKWQEHWKKKTFQVNYDFEKKNFIVLICSLTLLPKGYM